VEARVVARRSGRNFILLEGFVEKGVSDAK
jgi:hypothetical protein